MPVLACNHGNIVKSKLAAPYLHILEEYSEMCNNMRIKAKVTNNELIWYNLGQGIHSWSNKTVGWRTPISITDGKYGE